MKQLLIILCVFSIVCVQAQEQKKEETKEERRQRYIEEVNPFRELGYRPRIATLSNGKYREAFPDTIVQIGSFTYNRVSKRITAIRKINERLNESDLRPDLVSRWFSPDPLSDEFPSWSPYNFVENNPIRYVDPEGLAPQDVVIKGDDAKAAFRQLQASTDLKLKFTNGNVTIVGGTATTDADLKLQEAIGDHSIVVNLETTGDNFATTSDGVTRTFDGDAFFGSSVDENGIVQTKQLINVQTAKTIDKAANGRKGTLAKHAVLESFIGGKENPGAGDATANPSVRNSAHEQANNLDPNTDVNNSQVITDNRVNPGSKTRINVTGNNKRTPLFSVPLDKLGRQK